MNLTNIKGINKSVKGMRNLIILFAAVLTIGFVGSFLILSNKIDTAYTKSFIFDNKGNVYQTSTIDTKEMRGYEYENHIKTFFSLWYSFDEYTYKSNVEQALELIGDKGKELLNEYNDLNIYNTLIQKNIRYGIAITDIKVDLNTIPISGFIKGLQTGYRAKGSISRVVEVRFTLYDVARSQKNVHGCKIDDWSVNYSNVSNDGEDEKNEE